MAIKNKYEIKGNIVEIFLELKDESIVKAIIDKTDLNKVQEFGGRWCAAVNKKRRLGRLVPTGSFYVIESWSGHKTVSLHRWLMDCPDGLVVDHINHNTLDNTRANMRNVDKFVNAQNTRVSTANSSGYKGVAKCGNRWTASIRVNGEYTYLGAFGDPYEAGRVARDARAKFMPGYIEEFYEMPSV